MAAKFPQLPPRVRMIYSAEKGYVIESEHPAPHSLLIPEPRFLIQLDSGLKIVALRDEFEIVE